MLKSLYTLSQRYRNKKIVVYGVNRTSVNLFTDLVLNYNMDVYAFFDADDRFTGESFINRQIINIEQLKCLDNAIVVIPEINRKQNIQRCIGQEVDVFYKDEIIDLNEELRNKRLYIYGIGNKGGDLYNTFQDMGVVIEGVCVTKPGKIEKWCGNIVLSVEQVKQEDSCAAVLATDIESSLKEMLEQLEGCNIEIYISYFISVNVINNMNFFQVINIALLKSKSIWLYTNGDEHVRYLKEIFQRYQITIDREVYQESIYELGYENIDEISVVVIEKDADKSEMVCDILDSLGFGLERLDYTAINWCTCKANWSAALLKRDILLGRGIYVNEKYPGYDVYGDEKLAEVKIMVLGGSTSTSNVYRTVSWVECLYKIMLKAGYSPLIYNGSMCSYGVVDEYLRMTRDIEPLRPDIVISFSGVNNTSVRKAVNLFNTCWGEFEINSNNDVVSGMKSNETLYDFWCRISKLLRMVAEYHGARVYNFLQPMNSSNNLYDLIQTSMFELTEHQAYIEEFKEKASGETDQFYINLSSMLEGKKEMYIDACHYSNQASRLIAERVFEVIKQDL